MVKAIEIVEQELIKVAPGRGTALTIGVFDGVHLGHQHLISELKRFSSERSLLCGVITFRDHPQEVLSGGTKLPRITTLEERVRYLKETGVDLLVVLPFTTELSQLGAREFIGLLKKHLQVQGLVVGPDFALGRGRQGNIEALKAMEGKARLTLVIVAPVMVDGQVVSSTAVRDALKRGDMPWVSRLLGRPFSLEAAVVPGVERGRQLGFPTANLAVDAEKALPADGVYATRVHLRGQTYRSVTNVGFSPTFKGETRTVEVYVIEYSGNIYGERLRVDFLEQLRQERTFDSPKELAAQIERDVTRAISLIDL